jgi:hypothetical protein
MKYMLLIYGDEQAAAHATPEQLKAEGDRYEAFTQSIIASGNFLDGDPFMPTSMSRTVKVRDGATQASDGTPGPGDGQLTAYYKVEADSAAAAEEMASRIPGAAYGTIEVRPVVAFD